MSASEKRYDVKDYRNRQYPLTARQLYEHVMRDSKSDYNWIASATEIVRICRIEDFPSEYSKKIRIAILKCYTSLENNKDDNSIINSPDDDAVFYCYNSLRGMEYDVIETKRDYLFALIGAVSRHYYEFPVHSGSNFVNFCKDWQERKFAELIFKRNIDFKKLIKNLEKDFGNSVRIAEKNGIFKEDENEYSKLVSRCFSDLSHTVRKVKNVKIKIS